MNRERLRRLLRGLLNRRERCGNEPGLVRLPFNGRGPQPGRYRNLVIYPYIPPRKE